METAYLIYLYAIPLVAVLLKRYSSKRVFRTQILAFGIVSLVGILIDLTKKYLFRIKSLYQRFIFLPII